MRERKPRSRGEIDPAEGASGRLGAALLGSDDAIVSTASLMVGVSGEDMNVPIHTNHRVPVSDIVQAVESETAVDAHAGGFGLSVIPTPRGVYVDADSQGLATTVSRLVHSAFKHSRTHGHVSLTTTATSDQVLIEVEDECGGLAPSEARRLRRLLGEKGLERLRTGSGIAVSRRDVEALGGHLRVRDLPGRGCVFTVALPRV
jgi:signal transduction histidine kinase